jgi:hypothetical protein
LPKSSLSIDSSVATDLSEAANHLGKTLFGLANESIRSVVSVYSEGGIPQEIYPSWKLAKMSKDFGDVPWPFFTRELIDGVVQLAFQFDRKKLLEICEGCGRNFGIFLSVDFPKREDLIRLIEQLQLAFPSRVTELRPVKEEDDDDEQEKLYTFRYVSTLSKEMTECISSYLIGLFRVYSLRVVASKIGFGIIELQLEPT